MPRSFETLTPREVLALAIGVEQANARRFRSFAEVFSGYEPELAERFEELAVEEDGHEASLVKEFEKRFGTPIPVIEEVEVEGVIESVDMDDGEHLIFDSLKPKRVYELALRAERGAQEYYRRALSKAADPEVAALYNELAQMEDEHAGWLEGKLAEED